MSKRRIFLKTLGLTLLPIHRSLACSGESTFPKQMVLSRRPPFQNESLADFVTRHLKSRDWVMDNNNTVAIRLGAGKLEKGQKIQYQENINSMAILITPPEHYENKICTRVELFLENPIHVRDRDREVVGLKEYISRSKLISFSFPEPGKVTSAGIAWVDFGGSGKIICITRFDATTDKNSSTTLVTVSPEARGSCSTNRTLILSQDEALASCEQYGRSAPWSSHITPKDIENEVSACKEYIRYE